MTGRIYRARLVDTPVVPKGRIYRARMTGTTLASPKGRIYRAGMTGTAAVIVNPIAPRTGLEPETTITITASLQGGGVADSWTWRRVSGPDVGINGTGDEVTLNAPSHIDGCTVVVGVRATKDGTTSPEVMVSLTVNPQNRWFVTSSGLVPRKPRVLL